MLKTFSSLLFILLFINAYCQIRISEVAPLGSAGVKNANNSYYDWIEICNEADTNATLSNWYLSNKKSNPQKFPFSATIAPHSCILLAANTDLSTDPHTTIDGKLDLYQTLYLSNNKGELVDEMYLTKCDFDQSVGICGNSDSLIIFDTPSPGKANINSNISITSLVSGDSTYMVFHFEPSYRGIRTELGGKSVSAKSTLVAEKQAIISIVPNTLMDIPTTPLEGKPQLEYFKWKQPEYNYPAGQVVKYRQYAGDKPVSREYTASLLHYPAEMDAFTILSLTTDSMSLFDFNSGIYIPGTVFETQGWAGYWYPGNFHRKNEKNCNIELFRNKQEICNLRARMRPHGGGSACLPQKSLKIFFNKEYGTDRLNEPIFTHSSVPYLKRFVLRNGGNDFLKSHFKDALIHSICKDLNVEIQESEPVHAFFNGEYWGIFELRESYDEHYFRSHFDIGSDLSIIKDCGIQEYGDPLEYNELVAFAENNDLTSGVHYEQILSKIDKANYIDYMIAEIFFANYDWPGNNLVAWKSPERGNRWRWCLIDMDMAMADDSHSDANANFFAHAMRQGGGSWPNPDCSTVLFRKLMQNNEFKSEFAQRFETVLSTVLSSENILRQIDSFTDVYKSQIQYQILRWGYPQDIGSWYENIETMKDFATRRPDYIRQQVALITSNKCISDELIVSVNGNIVAFEGNSIEHIQILSTDGKVICNASPRTPKYEFYAENLISGCYLAKLMFADYAKTVRITKTASSIQADIIQ